MTNDDREATKDRLVKALEAEAKNDRALLLHEAQAAERIAEGKASSMEVGGLVGQLLTVQPGSDGTTINPCAACGGPGKVVTTVLGHAFVACVVEPQCGMIGPTRTSSAQARPHDTASPCDEAQSNDFLARVIRMPASIRLILLPYLTDLEVIQMREACLRPPTDQEMTDIIVDELLRMED